jgi:hypothetical protein
MSTLAINSNPEAVAYIRERIAKAHGQLVGPVRWLRRDQI